MHYPKDLGATASSNYILGLSGGLCDRRLFVSWPTNKRRSKKWHVSEVFSQSIPQSAKSASEKPIRSSEEEAEYQISPHHRRRPSPVRTPPPHLARRNRRRFPVESRPVALHLVHRRARAGRATAPSTRTQRWLSWAGWATVPLDQANSAGPRARKLVQYCAAIFWFSIFV
jgi:hypothetical protein